MAIQADANPHLARSPLVAFSRRPGYPVRGLATVLIGSTVIATCLVSGVSFADVARFAAFEALFVLLPGCMLYVALSRSPGGWLRIFSIGWPLGYAIEIGAFALTAAVDKRELFRLLPLLAVLTLGPFLAAVHGRSLLERMRRFRAHVTEAGRDRDHDLPVVVMGFAVSLAVTLLALRFFTSYPLPGHAHSVSYLPDNVFAISLAADARHHWPITEPYLAGQALHFYPGVFIHFAAVSQVSGVALSTVALRLFPTTIILVIALQLWLLCRELGGSRWTGTVAVILFFLVGELSLDATRFETFGVSFFDTLSEAPTNALGIPFVLALLAVVQRGLASGTTIGSPRGSSYLAGPVRAGTVGSLIMVGVLALGGGIVKTMAVADFVGGLALFLLLWRVAAVRGRRLLWAYVVISLICIGIVYYSALAGGSSAFRIQPFAFVHYSVFAPLFPAHSIVRSVLLAGAGVMAALFLFVPLLGAVWLLSSRDRATPFVIFSAAVFAVSVIAYSALAGPGDNEFDFMTYGYVAVIPVAAWGLARLWSDIPAAARGRVGRACLAMLSIGLVVAGSSEVLTTTGVLAKATLISAAEPLLGSKRLMWGIWYVAMYGLIAAATVFSGLKLEKYLMPAIRSRAGRILACCIPLVVTLGLVKPLGVAFPELWKTVLNKRMVPSDSREDQGMSAALYNGLVWVRDHTVSCDILAVNNHYLRANHSDPRYFYYSAFAERRVFMESWAYPAHWSKAQPFPARLALNDLATVRGNPAALRELERKGVTYVLIDKSHGGGPPEAASVSTRVFANRALDVYRLRASSSHSAAPCKPGVSS